MAQEHIDVIDRVIEKVVSRRREILTSVAASLHGDHMAELDVLQRALKNLMEAKADEESRLPPP
jgi:hypothetical protein